MSVVSDIKYQVFVSSTFTDLIEERQEAIRAILSLNHIPSGMEWFPASPEEQFQYIKTIIDQCDYYVLILGGRYGSVSPLTGISYTEMEFDYAREIGKHVLVFSHENPKTLPGERLEEKDAGRESLEVFRAKAMKVMVAKWKNPSDLRAQVLQALNWAIEKFPQTGWVRANLLGDSAAEAQKLIDQDQNLRFEIGHLKTTLGMRTAERDGFLKIISGVEEERKFGEEQLEQLKQQIRVLETATVVNALNTERAAGNPPSPGLVEALNTSVGLGGIVASEGAKRQLPTRVHMNSASLSLIKPTYENEWQVKLFAEIDEKLKKIQRSSAVTGTKSTLISLHTILEVMLKNTYFNNFPQDRSVKTPAEYIDKLISDDFSTNMADGLKTYLECFVRLRIDDPVAPIELDQAASALYEGIEGLKRAWKTAVVVLKAGIPLFGTAKGETPWAPINGLIVRRFHLKQAPQLEYLASTNTDFQDGDFVSWNFDRANNFGTAYYRPAGDGLDRFSSGAHPFIGVPLRFEFDGNAVINE